MTSENDFEAVLNKLDKMVGDFVFPVAVDYELLQKYCPTNEKRRFAAKFKMVDRIKGSDIKSPLDSREFLEFLNCCGPFEELTLDDCGYIFGGSVANFNR